MESCVFYGVFRLKTFSVLTGFGPNIFSLAAGQGDDGNSSGDEGFGDDPKDKHPSDQAMNVGGMSGYNMGMHDRGGQDNAKPMDSHIGNAGSALQAAASQQCAASQAGISIDELSKMVLERIQHVPMHAREQVLSSVMEATRMAAGLGGGASSMDAQQVIASLQECIIHTSFVLITSCFGLMVVITLFVLTAS